MRRAVQPGFTLLEVLVALILFAAVLLSMLATGQLVLARLFDSDLRFRSATYTQSLVDSLRATTCARLGSGSSSYGPLTASWSATNGLDVVRIDLTLVVPQRTGAPARPHSLTALLPCPEP